MQQTNANWVFLLNNDLALAADFCEACWQSLMNTGPGGCWRSRLHARLGNRGDQPRRTTSSLARRSAGTGTFEADTAAPADFFQAGACLIDRGKFLALAASPTIRARLLGGLRPGLAGPGTGLARAL